MGFTQLCGPAGNMLQTSPGDQYKPTVMEWSPIGFWLGQIPMAHLRPSNDIDCLDVYALVIYTYVNPHVHACAYFDRG